MAKDSSKTEKNEGSPPSTPSRELLSRCRDGDSQAANEVFDRYVARLVALARSRLSDRVRQRVDPEDVVQSAYRSFFVAAEKGRFELEAPGDLWRLLAQITLNKLHRQVDRQTAGRRDYRREEADASTGNRSIVAPVPSVQEAVGLIEQLQLVTERLSGDQREALASQLRGEDIEETCRLLAKSPRTVRRLLLAARKQVERQLLESQAIAVGDSEPLNPIGEPLSYSDFLLTNLIGAGGIGKVFRAEKRSTGEVVAVKALRKAWQNDRRAVNQFLHEASVLKRLEHPGIVGLQGVGCFPAGGYFLVLDYIDGIDLQSRIEAGQLGLNEGLRIVRQVALAIAYAHSQGVVHCDLKPANLLLRGESVIVTDFGFAWLLADNDRLTALGGTTGYLAPEVSQHRQRPEATADLYSLGVLLSKLIDQSEDTGSKVEAARTFSRRCMQSDPEHRPQTAEQFLEGLPS